MPSDPFAEHYLTGKDFAPQPALQTLMDRLWKMSVFSSPQSSLYFDGLMLQFVAETARSKALSPIAPDRPEDARIARAIEYAEAHLSEALTVAELAGVACLSAGHFSRAFKATTGEAVWSYVQRRRGERAMEMLQYTDRPIVEIAHACGFAHQGHMTACFRRQFGVTPGQVRRDYR